MSNLSISNVINVSVSEAGQGVGKYNTSNLAIFTNDIPAGGFGALGYKIYLEPTEVATDFGSSSKTYKMALAVFSQQLNILANGGYLVIIPMISQVQNLALSLVPASGKFKLSFNGNLSGDINWNDSASTIQATLRAVLGLGQVVVSGSLASKSLNIQMNGVYEPSSLFVVSSNTLADGTSAPVAIVVSESTPAEKLGEAVTRTASLVQYFGLMKTSAVNVLDEQDNATVVQALNKIYFVVSKDPADLSVNGIFDEIRQASLSKTRCLYYGANNELDALLMMASYAGRALSVNFSGSNTTQTMHLKDLTGVVADPSLTQTQLNLAKDCGADTYPSIQGVAKVFCSGANKFFDQVYNLAWFVGDLQVAGFNLLAQLSTKLPQTEQGMDALKNAYREVCKQAVNNQYLAPNKWTSPVTFGNQADFLANISQVGFYIYSVPVSQQSVADRVARKAPLVQIAVKEAGAVHSSDVIVSINA